MGGEDTKKDDTTTDEAGSAPNDPGGAEASPKKGFAEQFAEAFPAALEAEEADLQEWVRAREAAHGPITAPAIPVAEPEDGKPSSGRTINIFDDSHLDP